MGLNCKALCSAVLSALGAFLFGLDIGYIAPILECPSFKRDVAKISDPSESIPDATIGFIVGVFSIGCVLSSLPFVSGYAMDFFGRRDTIIFGTIVFAASAYMQARSDSVTEMIIGRFTAGLSIGLLSPVVALYQSEVAPPEARGALTSLYQLMITFGILVATALDHYFVELDGGWRTVIELQGIPAMIILVGMPLSPRSPRWLMQKGRKEEALHSLMALRGTAAEAREELELIEKYAAEVAREGAPRWSELCSGLLFRQACIGMSLQLLQQFVGMNAFMYFGPRIFSSLGWNPVVLQVIVNFVNFAATFPAVFIIDNIGRRTMLITGAIFMVIPCIVLVAVGDIVVPPIGAKHVQAHTATVVEVARYTVACMSFLFVGSFACSWGPAVWTYCSEMFPQKHRSRLMGLSTTANWVGNFFVAQMTPVLFGAYGFSTFGLFGTFCLVALALALWLPETKGVQLEHMDRIFEEKIFGNEVVTCDDEHHIIDESNRPLLYGSTSRD